MTSLPEGFGVALSESVRRYEGGRVLAGGTPFRVLRLSDAGLRALDALERGRAVSPAARELGGRLVDGGLASPTPASAMKTPSATVVIPVRDRRDDLERCLRPLAGTQIVVVDDGSAEPAPIRALCRRYRARYLRLQPGGGPAAARNAGLAVVDTELVAFLDSDCTAAPGWLDRLSRHFADPRVGAVAPRVLAGEPSSAPGVRQRYAAARSPLDLGPAAAEVGPGRPVPYVPGAALVVRRAALACGFDETLRYGEDVDLIWRLRFAGWAVRYDPAVTVRHREPSTWRALLARRYRYGTSAAPLSARHPDSLACVVIRPRPTAAAVLALAGHTGAAAALAIGGPLAGARRLRRVGVPAAEIPALGLAAGGQALLALSRAATTLAAPALVAGLAVRGTRRAALALLAAAPLAEWVAVSPGVDPVRWTAAALADDVAYGAGVWHGCLKWRTVEPLRPRLHGPSPRRRLQSLRPGTTQEDEAA